MERLAVHSSNIISVGYDSDTQTLEVEFNSGIYQYFDVPEHIYDELLNAGSLGSYLHNNIKDNFNYCQI
ncbi:KTSC domain-containing protein [Pseudoalteromonas sp. H71]|uniref:KTSC domain-containing protein n=1 Tax=Pseudoalteromonas sp. H71 TaxID=1348395 RepID=UPI0007318020|nr:KTSC domain-containing protein [Pseudoalteromonas sp. H71]KTD92229.1 hypothetical protein ATS71_18260 [Pseudoalteromonas sp. H71]